MENRGGLTGDVEELGWLVEVVAYVRRLRVEGERKERWRQRRQIMIAVLLAA